MLWALGVIGDLLAAQRVMTQRTFERVRRIELQLGVAPSHYEANAQSTRADASAAPAGAGKASSPPPAPDGSDREGPAQEREAVRL